MITLEIDGKKIPAQSGSMLIDVADDAGIRIPRFCYHKKLSVVANCRMCLVDVANSSKPLPACATPVADGMVVRTKSNKAISNQKSVMEFLLINHPLDCPICDQGGECELQDVAMSYGADVGRYSEAKRILPHKNAGPLISMDMTRCIHCTRCVRFGQEIAGEMELGLSGRNDQVQITNYLEKSIDSEVSGNMIDICPVGALTSRPFRYETRTWELNAAPSVAMHDMLGTNVFVHTKNNRIYRVVPRENEPINEVWIADRDRYAYEGNYHNRLTKPLIKVNNNWQPISWEDAFAKIQQELAPNLKDTQILFSDSLSVEEMYLANKIAKQGDMQNCEFRLTQSDFSLDEVAKFVPKLSIQLTDLEDISSVLVVGCNLRKEIPILNLRLRKAIVHSDAQINFLNPVDFAMNYPTGTNIISDPNEWQFILENLVDDFSKQTNSKEKQAKDQEEPVNSFYNEVKASLGNNSIIIIGGIAQNCQNYSNLVVLCAKLHQLTGCHLLILPKGANALAASLLQSEFNKTEKLTKASILVGVEPKIDIWNEFQKKVAESEFVVAISSHDSDNLRNFSDLILPCSTQYETGATHLNIQEQWQTQSAIVSPPDEAKQCWKILRVLANHLNLSGFDYVRLQQVTDEAKQQIESVARISEEELANVAVPQLKQDTQKSLTWLNVFSPYSISMLLRNSTALQKTTDAAKPYLLVNPNSNIVVIDSTDNEGDIAIEENVQTSPNTPETLQIELEGKVFNAKYDKRVALNLIVSCPFSDVEIKSYQKSKEVEMEKS